MGSSASESPGAGPAPAPDSSVSAERGFASHVCVKDREIAFFG